MKTIFLHALLFMPLLLAACEPTIAERGNMVDPDRLAKVKLGDSKDDVYKALGSATALGTFDENNWYYIGQRTEQEAFFLPEVTDREVVEIDFDDNDQVAAIKKTGKDQGNDIAMVQDTSPAEGRETSFAEDVFGRPADSSAEKKKKGI
jgi:outer membrane protein assembly factor BamE (lipoprotein component of BamABCDE complex)